MTAEPGDDQQWLDLLAGRMAPDADARTQREAAWMRAALLNYREAAPPGMPADADARVSRLLARARQAGVLDTAANEPGPYAGAPQPRRSWLRWPQMLAAGLAACTVAVMLLPIGQGTAPDDGVMRSAPAQTFTVEDAPQRRQLLLLQLRAAGFDAEPYERLGRPGIDVGLPVPLPAAQAAALKRLGLAVPTGPSLQIEFLASPPPAR